MCIFVIATAVLVTLAIAAPAVATPPIHESFSVHLVDVDSQTCASRSSVTGCSHRKTRRSSTRGHHYGASAPSVQCRHPERERDDPATEYSMDGPLVARHGLRDDFDPIAFCSHSRPSRRDE